MKSRLTLNTLYLLLQQLFTMELTHLEKSNNPPSDTERSFFIERLASLDDNLDLISGKLAVAQQAVGELQAQHLNLHEKRETFSSIVSPLRRLPPDLLSEVFLFTVWSSPRLVSDLNMDQRFFLLTEGLNWGRSNVKSMLHPTGSPFDAAGRVAQWLQEKQLVILTRICHEWRSVAIHTPLLWNDLQLQVYNNDPPLDAFVDHLQLWFDRAQDVPLSFTLLFSKEVTRNEPPSTYFSAFLYRNRRRWKELKLNMPSLEAILALLGSSATLNDAVVLDSQSQVRPPGSAGGLDGEADDGKKGGKDPRAWSNLETFALSGWFAEDMDTGVFSMDGEDEPKLATPAPETLHRTMPSLRSLTLYLPYRKINRWNWIPWAQLSKLHLRSADTYEDYVRFLEKCRELKRCYLFFNPSLRVPVLNAQPPLNNDVHESSTAIYLDTDEESNAKHVGLIHLPLLKEINLEINHIVPLIDKLVSPNLTRLSISQDMRLRFQAPEPNIGQALLDFIDRSSSFIDSSPLESEEQVGLPITFLNLHLHGYPVDLEPDSPRITTQEYLQMFERLKKLQILHIKDGATNAEFLDLVEERGLLPELKTILVEVGQDDDAKRRFERFVKARTLAKGDPL